MKVYRNVYSLIVIFIMVIIFGFSFQPREKSNNLSKFITEAIVRVLPQTNNLPKEKQVDVVSSLNVIVRKYAHFSLFFLLGIFVSLTLLNKKATWTGFAYSLLFCLLYAVSDELHQSFVPGRGCQIKDVIIDFSGSCLGSGIVMLFKKIR